MNIIAQWIEPPVPTEEHEKLEVIGGMTPGAWVPSPDWRGKPDGAHRDTDFGPFFPVFSTVDAKTRTAEPIHPRRALKLISEGKARLSDPDDAYGVVTRFLDAVQALHKVRQEYVAPISEEHALRRVERRDAVLHRMGITDGENVDPRAAVTLLNAQEVADLLGISPKTVYARSGQDIPASLNIGDRRLWRADAILSLISRAA